ncbi:MAG TPA: hypothetical protein VHO23_01685 [Candidatus Paceibacterota bacterium]|nr:hypothetical protein [Candidatus Paceibacterota bacterium]
MARTVTDHLEHLRAKPHHVRRQISFLAALVVTGLVTAGWLGAMATSGSFALDTTTLADGGAEGATLTNARNDFSSLLGAAGAAIGATSSPREITVVDVKSWSSLEEAPDNQNDTTQTTLHF